MTDLLQRFLFENTDIRGELTCLEHSYKETLSAHQYPQVVANLLGEFLAAAALLSATLKFEGSLTLQARSEGEIPIIMAEATSSHQLRAIAKEANNARSDQFHELLTNGRLIITISPKQGKRYQGIVALEGSNLAECLEEYFRQSEQLSTRIWLCSNGQQAAGMMLQELPASQQNKEQREHHWQHLTQLADTLTTEELLSLPFDKLLYRLYHQETVRLFDANELCFQCSCSESRTISALYALGQQELQEILKEQGTVDINCEFCHQHYRFDSEQIHQLFEPPVH